VTLMERLCANDECPLPGAIRFGILWFCEECAADLYAEGW